MKKDGRLINQNDKILCGNIGAVVIIAVFLMMQSGIAGMIDFAQMIWVFVIMSVEILGIRLFKKRKPQNAIKYTGIIAGLLSMLLTLGNYVRLYGTINLLLFRISIISLLWGNIFNMITVLILGKYVSGIRAHMRKFMAYRRLRKEKQLQKSMDILWDSMKQSNHENEAERLYKETKSIRHDMKNQMNIVQALLEQGEYNKAQEYLAQYYGEVQTSGEDGCYCRNEMINLLIKNTKGICQKSGIAFYAAICNEIPEKCNMDLCVLLGNALDNAVEGCSGEKPQVCLDIRRKDNFLLIDVRNTIKASVLEKNPALTTTKSNSAMHGLGISSMKKLAEKYFGTVEFAEEAGFFICSILLDLETE